MMAAGNCGHVSPGIQGSLGLEGIAVCLASGRPVVLGAFGRALRVPRRHPAPSWPRYARRGGCWRPPTLANWRPLRTRKLRVHNESPFAVLRWRIRRRSSQNEQRHEVGPPYASWWQHLR